MANDRRKPLILVADDVPDMRERLLPGMIEIMGCRVCKAADVKEALIVAEEHAPDTRDPLDLIICDMHLPMNAEHAAEIEDDGGVRCVRFYMGYKLPMCPIVIFTAYPTFANCVAAVKAGADAYIPKMKMGEEGGPDALRETCEKLLRQREEGATEVPPTSEWLDRNARELTEEFGDEWAAFVDAKELPGAAREGRRQLDGVILLSGKSYEDVRRQVIESPDILKARPRIMKVRGRRSAPRGKGE